MRRRGEKGKIKEEMRREGKDKRGEEERRERLKTR